MNAKEFVELIKEEKEEIVNRYVTPLENIQIKDTKFCKEQIKYIAETLNYAVSECLYTILLWLDGEANICVIQQPFKIYDEQGNLIAEDGDLELAAYESFHNEEN